jgi:hypothetical protein
MSIMDTFEQIPPSEIQFFKEKVQRWLHVDKQISELEKQIRELKKVRNKELEPQITEFMTKNNVTDLNTENGKLRCQARKTKQGFNKNNIRQNLSTYLTDQEKLEQAVQDLCTNREIVIKYTLKKLKN